jgi:hypothetical protein
MNAQQIAECNILKANTSVRDAALSIALTERSVRRMHRDSEGSGLLLGALGGQESRSSDSGIRRTRLLVAHALPNNVNDVEISKARNPLAIGLICL